VLAGDKIIKTAKNGVFCPKSVKAVKTAIGESTVLKTNL